MIDTDPEDVRGTWTITLEGGPALAANLAQMLHLVAVGKWRGDPAQLSRLAEALRGAEFTPAPREAAESPKFWRHMPYPVAEGFYQIEHDGRTWFVGIKATAELIGEAPAPAPLQIRAGLGRRITDMIKADIEAGRQ